MFQYISEIVLCRLHVRATSGCQLLDYWVVMWARAMSDVLKVDLHQSSGHSNVGSTPTWTVGGGAEASQPKLLTQ